MNSLFAFMANTLNSGSAAIATDDTETYNVLSTLDNTRYYLSSLLHKNGGTVIHTYTDGVAHYEDATKKIVYRLSTNDAQSFGAASTLYDPSDSNFQVQDPGLGLDSNGRLHIMADCHNNIASTGQTHELRYMTSDDNGVTVSSPVVIALPSNGLASFRMYGRIIQAGNVLMAPCYFFTDEGDFTNSARYVLRSTDFGANWTWIEVETGTDYINESELLAIDDDIVIMVSRQEASPKQFIMYKSLDKGLTWTRIGVLSTNVIMSLAAPCRLHKFFLDEGTEIAVMYFSDKANDRLYAMYGRLNNFVVGGIGGWNLNTLTLLRTDTEYIHYGDMLHYNNNLNARGAWTREASTTPLVDNEIILFENLSTNYGSLFEKLTPITIYDNLAAPTAIYSWRGLLLNNVNDYGEVNVSGQLTTLKSLVPGVTGLNFTASAGGIILGDGIEFDGTKVLTHGTPTNFNFTSYSSAGYTDVNWTLHACVKFGTGSNPDAAYGLFGSNGTSAGNIGIAIFYDDRVSQSINNGLKLAITRSGGTFIINFANANIITPNTFQVLTIECDLSLATQDDKIKVYINGALQSTTVTTFNTTVNTPPTYNPQIGGCGNNTLPMTGAIKHIIFQNAVDIASVRNEMIDTLMDLEGL